VNARTSRLDTILGALFAALLLLPFVAAAGMVRAPAASAAVAAGAQRVSYSVTCNGHRLTIWADFERSGGVRRGVRGGFSGPDWTLTYGRLGVLSAGASKATDVRFNPVVIAGSGYSTGAVLPAADSYVLVVPWYRAGGADKACNDGFGWTIPAPA
jgi:hypothetical protein